MTAKKSEKIHIPEDVFRFELPAEITRIPNRFFSGNWHLRELILPDTVQIYDRGALFGISLDLLSVPYARTLELAFPNSTSLGYVKTTCIRMPDSHVIWIFSKSKDYRNSLSIISEVLQILRTGDFSGYLHLPAKASAAVYLAYVKQEASAQAYVKKIFVRLACVLIDYHDLDDLKLLFELITPNQNQIKKLVDHAITVTQKSKDPEIQVFLMNYQNQKYQAPDFRKKFRL